MSQWLCWWISGVTRNHRPGSRLAQQKGLPGTCKATCRGRSTQQFSRLNTSFSSCFSSSFFLFFRQRRLAQDCYTLPVLEVAKTMNDERSKLGFADDFKGWKSQGCLHLCLVLYVIWHVATTTVSPAKGRLVWFCLYSNWCPTVLEDVGLSRLSPTQYTCCPKPKLTLDYKFMQFRLNISM